jgi:hypothetical protein
MAEKIAADEKKNKIRCAKMGVSQKDYVTLQLGHHSIVLVFYQTII